MNDAAFDRPAWVAPGASTSADSLMDNEWLVTNGLGGYSSSTIGGVMTRKYHGYLVSALPSPLGRMVMLQNLFASIVFEDGSEVVLTGHEQDGAPLRLPAEEFLRDFRLEVGLPVWEYDVRGVRVERRVVMPHEQNTVHVIYRALAAPPEPCVVRLRPFVHFRSYEAPVNTPHATPLRIERGNDRLELHANETLPPLRLLAAGSHGAFTADEQDRSAVVYRHERDRGYEWAGDVWSPGYFELPLRADLDAALSASTDGWQVMESLSPGDALDAELERRRALLRLAGPAADDPSASRLVLSADQFIIRPATRVADEARARATGEDRRTVIAGYPWFTDWGRDTMISLEGLTLCTGRHREATSILHTFADYVRDGLIPNMFPDGANEGLYHTADATLWFFHAVHRYVEITGHRDTLRDILPRFREIVRCHRDGTRFGIGVDARDGLLREGAEGYQLTWMDAKVDGWVVTPRRGKAVEINALWFNALSLLARWLDEEGAQVESRELADEAARVRESFNRRFWYEEGGYLYDVIDGESGDDTACRPNQIFSISLDYPVLDESRWRPVVETVRTRLLTPVGLRSLAPGHPDYKSRYFGDLRARDAAYHQGTVWAWLIGPFVDAWLRVHPEDHAGARALLTGLVAHLDVFGVGSIAEIFDAEAPFTPRGCTAQAWSVAEVLRAWLKTGMPVVHDRREGSARRDA
ncbi:MAG TPA: amylo-alpha-1,6-glucosidase [Gemmatimonadaceae bacterium]|nr:amylo-alpha-1,6-glucosidase [Gemmatimonadaceae bacterium]